MRTPVRLLMMVLVATTLTLAGCSYTPARLETRPLLEVDGYDRHRHYRGDDRHYRHRHRHERRQYHDRRDHRRGGFCPPGLRMQGRC